MTGWGFFCFVIGWAMALAGIILLIIDLMKYRKTIGKVVGNKSSYAGDSPSVEVYAPTIRFTTDEGEDRTFQSLCYFSSRQHNKGEPIPVRYHPTYAKLNGINRLVPRFYLVAILIFFGFAFVSLGMQI